MYMEHEINEKRFIRSYEFVPDYHRWLTMSKQKEIANKLENITKDRKK